MSSPFEQCGALAVCASRKLHGTDDDTFVGAGRLFMVITPRGGYVYVGDKPPAEVNEVLRDLGVSVRVDEEGKPHGPA